MSVNLISEGLVKDWGLKGLKFLELIINGINCSQNYKTKLVELDIKIGNNSKTIQDFRIQKFVF